MKKSFLFIIAVLFSMIIPFSIAKGQNIDEINQLKAEKKALEEKLKRCQNNNRQKNVETIQRLQKEKDSLSNIIEDIRGEVEKVQSEAEAKVKAEIDAKSIKIDNFIKDSVFLEYLLWYCDMDNDGVLTQWDAEHTYVIDIGKDDSHLNFYDPSNQITSIDGIEKFVNLKWFVCSGNTISKIDLSRNIQLETIIVNGCKLEMLDVSKNEKLKHLECRNNLLESINLKNTPNLLFLDVCNNRMSTIDISLCTKLKIFNCSGNALVNLDVSNNMELRTIDCSNNNICEMSFIKNTLLDNINCSKNKLTNVDVRNDRIVIRYIDCSKNKYLRYVYFSEGCKVISYNRGHDTSFIYRKTE